jgi:UDP-N-acetylmuramoyl-tripeptide--D-alanyl-D-alanine ligase
MLTLADILEALTGKRIETTSLFISEATIDSRQAIPASMFVALSGEKTDGHEYVQEAFKRGAHLALVQKDLSAQLPTLICALEIFLKYSLSRMDHSACWLTTV